MTDAHALPAPAGEKVGPFQVVILALSIYVLVAMFVEATVALPRAAGPAAAPRASRSL